MKYRYQSPEGDGSAGGAGATKVYTQEEVDALTSGLRSKTSELLAETKAAKAALKNFDGIDPVQARETLKLFENNEELRLIREGKHDQVFEAKTKKLQEAHAKALEDQKQATEAARARSEKFSRRVLNDALRAAAIEADIHKDAIDDALLHGSVIFQLDDNGNAVQMEDGHPVLGKDGKTPFSPKDWLEQIAPQKPHWFRATSSGAPNGGSPAGSGRQKTMKLAEFNQLPPMERSRIAREKVIKIID